MSMAPSFVNAFLVQESISIMFVSLGLAIIGLGYAKVKTKEAMIMHRWVMSGAIILGIASMIIVMFPSLYIYYAVPDVNAFSGFSVLQIIHSILGVPTLVLSVAFLFNRLPKPTKRWMQVMAVLWIVGIVLGAIVYYTMPS
jgi:uncharacterized membrane protein YozB (DUF420 family)